MMKDDLDTMLEATIDQFMTQRPSGLFAPMDAGAIDGIVLGLYGPPKSGKTHISLTFPEPIYFLNTDLGAREIRRKHFPTKNIQEIKLVSEKVGDIIETAQLLQTFHAAYLEALQVAGTGTVIVDTASHVWSWVQVVKLQEVREKRIREATSKGRAVKEEDVRLYPFDYANANLYMGNLLRLALVSASERGTNTIFIHHSKEIYGDGGRKLPGFELAGFSHTGSILPHLLRVYEKGGNTLVSIDYWRGDRSLEGLHDLEGIDYEAIKDLYLGKAE